MGRRRLLRRSPSSSLSSSSKTNSARFAAAVLTKTILVAVVLFNFAYYQLRSSFQIVSSSSSDHHDHHHNNNNNVESPWALSWWSSSLSSSSSPSPDSVRGLLLNNSTIGNLTTATAREDRMTNDTSIISGGGSITEHLNNDNDNSGHKLHVHHDVNIQGGESSMECDDLDMVKKLILLDINDDSEDHGGAPVAADDDHGHGHGHGRTSSGNDQERKTMKMKWYTSPRTGSSTTNELSNHKIQILMEGPTKWQNLADLFETTLAPSTPTRTTTFISGRFRSFEKNLALGEEEQIHAWLPRLFFLALHHRFHQPAYEEYKNRQQRLQQILLERQQYQQQQRQQQETNPTSNCNHSITATLTEIIDMNNLTELSSSSSSSGTVNVTSPSSGFVKPPGDFEFVCPDSKFLVMGIGSQGFGAFINTSGLTLILAALRTGRIPVFWNIPEQQKNQDWLLAPHDCDERTLTCYFLPLSPCTLTLDDITNATRFGIEKPDKRWFRRNLALPPEFDDKRVVVVDGGMIPSPFDQERLDEELATMNRAVINATVQTSMELLSYWKESDPSLPELPIIKKSIKVMDEQSKVMFAGYEGVWAYLLRLNPKYQRIVGNQTSNVLSSSSKDSTFENSIGFPVRGSDKCIRESTCLSVQTYMDLAIDLYNNNGPLHNTTTTATTTQTVSVHPPESYHPNLILTTEDAEIFNEAMQLSRNARATTSSGISDIDYNNITSSNSSHFPYRFLLNSDDNLQGSGNPRKFRHDGHNTIVSSLVAIILQLHASNVYGNCCSNWHKVIHRLVEGGLSSTQDASFTCLNLAPAVFNKPKYRICCHWKRDHQCKQIYKEYNNQTGR